MDIIELIHNTALLVALVALYQVLLIRRLPNTLPGKLLFGLLFALVAIVGMMDPLVFAPGIIFDGRSIIMAIAGYIGGPLVALVSAVIAGAYRLWLGGDGAVVGVLVVISAALIGLLFRWLKQRRGEPLGPLLLFGFGLSVQLVMLGLYTFLPDDAGWAVITSFGANILLFYPLATMLIILLFEDYEAQEESRRKYHHLAFYDPLSGLPNRSALTQQLQECTEHATNEDERGALFLLNIDRFKRLNDARGHTIGDAVLCAVGQRLEPLLGRDSLLARLSADEFACLLRSGANEKRIQELSEAIHLAFNRPVKVGADEFTITVSLGIATLPEANDSPADIMRRADTALHHAKRSGGSQSARFAQTMADLAKQQLQLERDLRTAITENQLQLYLQSQVDNGGRVVGAEALLRWQHPQQGLIPPIVFIPLAEESDLIVELDIWVVNQVCELLKRPEVLDNNLRLSVNISPRHFHQPGFSAWLCETLSQRGTDPHLMTLEITEGLLVENLKEAAGKMEELAALGFRFSLDDFGTGYSSLAYIKQLPIHELKIDKIFVQDAPNDPTIVESILAVAEHMRLDVVAEGVETEAHGSLFATGINVFQQGYLYGRPEPAEQWLAHVSANPGSTGVKVEG